MNKQYYQKHKERLKIKNNIASRKWRESHPEAYILSGRRSNAKRSGIEFSLSIEDIQIPDVCPYLKVPLQKLGANKGIRSGYAPSLDRIDPSKGYVKGNVEIISDLANKMKSNASKEQLVQFAKSVLKKWS